MPSPSPRRWLRRAVTALAVMVLLASGYVGSFVGLYWVTGFGVVSGVTFGQLRTTLFAPAESYIKSDYPGGRTLNRLTMWFFLQGRGTPATWEQLETVT